MAEGGYVCYCSAATIARIMGYRLMYVPEYAACLRLSPYFSKMVVRLRHRF